ncbi:GNAT family N-acetyltransferase [Thalassobius sp. Cn5-15]|uniref:GNAT family N-acetyltransferase n=1 Tax=Thalassobius sp. Cn5-15 TaxID=2917763 RepID=UPI001EF191AD|nr:GNAT family N-acetyltransferase [Thalassobius sp. Cn5-15]MCG7493631.1 GNAT family N-acetyltransferase [Thalassobius sp. Cn5-15]
MTLIIRPLDVADQADWHRLWTAYLEFYESTVSEAVSETTFARLIDPARTQQNGMIALLDGAPVGLVHYIYHAHNWQVEDCCYLQDLYAAPSVRGQGIGRALIEAVYKAADDNGTPKVYWMTQEFNKTARQLYDRIAQLTPFVKYSR